MRIYDLFENTRLIATPAFQRWFADSKVVDADGKPLRVYHGTNQPIDRFKAARRGLSTNHPTAHMAFWFTDHPETAHDYAKNAGERTRADIDTFERQTADLQRKAEALERVAQRTNRSEDWDAYEKAMLAWETMDIDSMRADPLIGQNIVPVYLRLVNPLDVDAKGNGFFSPGFPPFLNDVVEEAKRGRHDGVIIRNVIDAPTLQVPATHYAVFNARQIKSAISG